jgi:hypothetical protein
MVSRYRVDVVCITDQKTLRTDYRNLRLLTATAIARGFNQVATKRNSPYWAVVTPTSPKEQETAPSAA